MTVTSFLAAGPKDIAYVVVGIFAAALVLVVGYLVFSSAKLWFQAYMSRAGVTMWEIVGMRLRKVNPNIIVQAKIMAVKSGLLTISTSNCESHYLAGGNVPNVIRALIAANRAGISLDFNTATSIDLAGRNVLDAVRTSVNPKVIDCPASGSDRNLIEAVAADGIQVRTKARVTVRSNIARLVGGATEETIIARVGEGIVTTIGSCKSYKDVLANPAHISRTVLEKGLDSGTAFEILSVDIADVDVGSNIGARLQADQAEADKRVAQAKAEERRAMAVAREQEMSALIQENEAKVVLAESEVPQAISQAFREGNLGVMDFQHLKNTGGEVSDTKRP